MGNFLIRWFILTIAAAVMVVLLPGMHVVGHPPILGIAAFSLFMALFNASLKPVVQMLALPFSVLTFGLLALVINWLFMELASWLAINLFDVGVTIGGFWWAVLAHHVAGQRNRERRSRPMRRRLANTKRPAGKCRGPLRVCMSLYRMFLQYVDPDQRA